jgi:hypothetical protein
MLKAFIEQDYICNWPGCDNTVVRHSHQITSKNCHCLKHTLYKLSGRVSSRNWRRDYYREHLKAKCALSGKTWTDAYQEVKEISHRAGYNLSRKELIVLATRQFQVDHIDGNHYNNDVSNLQTLTAAAHKLKSELNGDYNPYKGRV